MYLLREVTEVQTKPLVPDGWDVGHLGDLGVLLSCDDFSTRFNVFNLNLIFDFAEGGYAGEVRDHSGRIIEVQPQDDGLLLIPRDEPGLEAGILLDLKTLKLLGIEQYEEDDGEHEPDSEFDDVTDDGTIVSPGNKLEFDLLDEGVKKAFRRSGKKIKPGFRVTSGFRKGRVVASAAAAFKPRKSAKTRTKLRLAARRKKVIRVLKGKRTRRKSSSQRLVRMNKRLK